MKKILLFASALLLLAACDNFKTQVYQDNLELALEEGRTDSLLFSISLEYATGGMSHKAMEKMNEAIILQAFDLEEIPCGLEELADGYRTLLIDEYVSENRSLEDGGVHTWEDSTNGMFRSSYRNWRNYLLSYYTFRGGAHGIQTVSQLVFDKKTGELVTESDLFAPGYEEPVAQLMRASVQAEMEAEAPELLELVEMELVVPNGNFSVGEGGVQWIFQPYEVGPYALGIVMASVSWEELQPYLNQ